MGAKTFGPNFRPPDFQGPLEKHYPKREDLFQQLVGAFFLERFPQRVSVSPTKGKDGGIDVFIKAASDPGELFYDLPFPIIVECKDHDDSLGTVTNNVKKGWSRVKKDLASYAKSGWQGMCQPWRDAKGYLYCISAVLPHQQARKDLTQSIRDFFASLPPEQKPAIEDIHVLDWSDLASRLNDHTRLADSWLGTELEGILGYTTYEARLTGFRLYLKEEKLSFIPPTPEDKVHPENLLASLEQQASAAGLLIIGPGGVGKTRTCFEVARLAHQRGWRVLHLLPGEPAVTADDLQKIVLQGCTPTLLVIDYLDQMGSLDFGTIRHRLLPETQARAIPLALLANARPGLLRKANPEREALFQRIDLDIKDRRARIAAQVQETIAPRASTILGPKRVREICGTRPIIGMFIARELESYAREDKLDDIVLANLRHGDLQGWIRRRFEEDGLVTREIHPLLPASPDEVMTAAAAGFAAAPLSRTEMFRVISATLAAAGTVETTATAGDLIASLVRSGWLEETGYELTTPHDVIADELLELTLCDRERHTVRGGVTDKVFMGARAMPRVLGRFSVSLDRVMGQQDFSEQLLQSLKATLSTWLACHAAAMGQTFTTADPDEVSYALGAVLTGAAWGEAALRVWDDLIAPWLALHAQSAEARHLLYRGLKELPEQAADGLADMALRWVSVHSPSLEASYVLGPLLARQDLGEQVQAAVTAALAWLKEHGTAFEARFVLGPLLARQDLGEQARAAVTDALTWLKEHGKALDAQFVFHTLLARQDLGEQAQAAVKDALAWLAEHDTAFEAGFVLPPLLARQDLGEQVQAAVTAALAWLKEHGTAFEARFVLGPLLARPDLEEQARAAVTDALTWLKEHGKALEAQFVFHTLLARQDLGEQAQPAVNAAMEWLAKHGTALEARFVLPPLLARQDLGEQAQPAVTATLDWLAEHGTHLEAGFVLPPLLARKDLGVQAQPAVNAAMEWLEIYPLSQDAEFVLNNLLGKSHLSGDGKKRCITIALQRLDTVIDTSEASFLLESCLKERTLSEQERIRAVACALKWLRLHAHLNQIDFVFKRLLRSRVLEDELWLVVAEYAFDWLRRTPVAPDRDHALNSLLARVKCLTPEEKTYLLQNAQKWLQAFPHSNEKKRLLDNLQRLTDVGYSDNLSAEPADSLGMPSTSSLSEFLREHVEKGELPDNALLHQGLWTVHALHYRNHPGRAGYYLSSLLPLAALKGDPSFIDQVAEAVRLLLEHPDLTSSQRQGFTRVLYRLLDEGAWPDREEGERLLSSLAIHRPPKE